MPFGENIPVPTPLGLTRYVFFKIAGANQGGARRANEARMKAEFEALRAMPQEEIDKIQAKQRALVIAEAAKKAIGRERRAGEPAPKRPPLPDQPPPGTKPPPNIPKQPPSKVPKPPAKPKPLPKREPGKPITPKPKPVTPTKPRVPVKPQPRTPKPTGPRTPKPTPQPKPQFPKAPTTPKIPTPPSGLPPGPVIREALPKILRGAFRILRAVPDLTDILTPSDVAPGELFPPGSMPGPVEPVTDAELVVRERSQALEKPAEIEEITVTAPRVPPVVPPLPALAAPALGLAGLPGGLILPGIFPAGASTPESPPESFSPPGTSSPGPSPFAPGAPSPSAPPAPVAPPAPIAPPTPAPPIGTPSARLPGQQQARCKPCQSTKRRRKKGECHEGYFRDVRGKTEYINWRRVDCVTGKTKRTTRALDKPKKAAGVARQIQNMRTRNGRIPLPTL